MIGKSIRSSMMFSKALLAASLVESTFANPVPSGSKTPLERRASVPDDDACMVKGNFGFNNVEVYAAEESMPIEQVCGQGYLDNARRRCGFIADRKSIFVEENVNRDEEKEKNEGRATSAKMTFKTSVFFFWDDIKEAMCAASAVDGKKQNACTEPEEWTLG